MQPYNNYLTPMYSNQFQAQYQPQYQPMMQSNNIVGKFVQNQEVISANDVPMNGTPAIFPKSDMSEIYVKSWNANGTIDTMTFTRLFDVQTVNSSSESQKSVNDPFNELREAFEKRFDALEKRLGDKDDD